MGRLIYSMITSLDGYAAPEGQLGFDAQDEEVHGFIGDLFRPVGTYLYGRRMYQQMLFWETVDRHPEAPDFVRQFGLDWRAAEKVVYSSTLSEVSSARTRIERSFQPDDVRRLKHASPHDLTVDGPTLAAQAIRAGLVDEHRLFTTSTVTGGAGTRFFPDGIRLELELVEHRVFGSGLVYTRYLPR